MLVLSPGVGFSWRAQRDIVLAGPPLDGGAAIRESLGDPSQDYFVDGITENLTTDLSRIRKSFVIAARTALTYKGRNLDAKEIGKELGVRYVVEGSVQRDQNRVRVNAQLIDATSGAHLGPSASRRTSPTSSSCKIKSWRVWATRSALSW